MGASIFDHAANLEVLRIKGSSDQKPMSILFQSENQLKEYLMVEMLSFIPSFIELLSKEVTFLLPHKYFCKKIPQSIYMDSDKIGVRLASRSLGEKINLVEKNPITTTSLNKKDESPILDEDTAKEFYQAHIKFGKFISSNHSILSGHASTIISITGESSFSVIRRGARADELEKIIGI